MAPEAQIEAVEDVKDDPIERAKMYRDLAAAKRGEGFSRARVAAAQELGISLPTFNTYVALLQLPEEIQRMVSSRQIPPITAIIILRAWRRAGDNLDMEKLVKELKKSAEDSDTYKKRGRHTEKSVGDAIRAALKQRGHVDNLTAVKACSSIVSGIRELQRGVKEWEEAGPEALAALLRHKDPRGTSPEAIRGALARLIDDINGQIMPILEDVITDPQPRPVAASAASLRAVPPPAADAPPQPVAVPRPVPAQPPVKKPSASGSVPALVVPMRPAQQPAPAPAGDPARQATNQTARPIQPPRDRAERAALEEESIQRGRQEIPRIVTVLGASEFPQEASEVKAIIVNVGNTVAVDTGTAFGKALGIKFERRDSGGEVRYVISCNLLHFPRVFADYRERIAGLLPPKGGRKEVILRQY